MNNAPSSPFLVINELKEHSFQFVPSTTKSSDLLKAELQKYKQESEISESSTVFSYDI
jgi:hypothetical protein